MERESSKRMEAKPLNGDYFNEKGHTRERSQKLLVHESSLRVNG